MGTEQQFCLKWNNHQSTIVAGFDTLLENGTLVDCTLAAEGKYLKAHKVVLSACSPYFELLLSQHHEKHPIIILKDVKFQELKAMVDYMYHGEVNISQDQLGALLKAAESLQIKGLSDSGGGSSERDNVDKRHHGTRKQTLVPPPQPRSSPVPLASSLQSHRRSAPQIPPVTAAPPPPPPPPPIVDIPEDDSPPPPPRPQALPRVPSSSREGSISPPPKRKRHRRRSSGGGEDGSLSAAPVPLNEGSLETSNSSELGTQPAASLSGTVPTIPANITPVVPTSSEVVTAVPVAQSAEQPSTETEMLSRTQQEVASPRQPPHEIPHEPVLEPVQKVEPPAEVMLEPKAEYVEDVNEDSVEDLTLDDDMDEMDHARPGPSHGGEGSSSQGAGFAPWHVADRSTDEVFMAAQEAVGAHRDSQDMGRWPEQEPPELEKFLTGQDGLASAQIFKDFGLRLCGNEYMIDSSQSTTHPHFFIEDNIQHKLLAEVQENTYKALITETHTESNINKNKISAPQNSTPKVKCPSCGKHYTWKYTLNRHLKFECGKARQFPCPFCPHRFKRKCHLTCHMDKRHPSTTDIQMRIRKPI